jgi:hypothetical protein
MSNTPEQDAADTLFAPAETPKRLPFPPVTKQHILNCSYHSWHPQ